MVVVADSSKDARHGARKIAEPARSGIIMRIRTAAAARADRMERTAARRENGTITIARAETIEILRIVG